MDKKEGYKAEIILNKDREIDFIKMKYGDLNTKDFEILHVLLKKKVTISELSRLVDIAPVNLWKHLKKLRAMGIVKVPLVARGKKKYPELTNKDKVKKFIQVYEDLINLKNG